MTDLTLNRFSMVPDIETFGKIDIGGSTVYTCERPWLNNLPNVSCIPLGEYECKPRRYNKGGYDAVEICDVEARTHILIHRGNVARHVQGCVLVGTRIGVLSSPEHGFEWAVLGSGEIWGGVFWPWFETTGDGGFRLKIQLVGGASPESPASEVSA